MIPETSLAKQTDDIYSILKFVIKKEGFDRKYGILLTPNPSCNLNTTDKEYLQTLLINPKPTDLTIKTDSSGFVLISELFWPDKNILTQSDINYILKNKQKLANFKWDNERLGFDTANKKYYYTFSIPYFNIEKDKVLLMYEFLCPGLCGNGRTLLLTKTKNGWDITSLKMWFH
ncbi:MAG: hypothetical protein R2796_06940 [Chitinophagaceae bacterium]